MAQQISEQATHLSTTITSYLKNKWEIDKVNPKTKTIHLALQKGKNGIPADSGDFFEHDLVELLDSIQDYFSANGISLIGFPNASEKRLSFEFASLDDVNKAADLLGSFMPQKEKGGRC